MMLRNSFCHSSQRSCDLAEHVAADRAVGRAVDAVVLLLLHGEVGPQDLLERVLLLAPSGTCSRSRTGTPARGRAAPRRAPGSSREPWPRFGDSSALLGSSWGMTVRHLGAGARQTTHCERRPRSHVETGPGMPGPPGLEGASWVLEHGDARSRSRCARTSRITSRLPSAAGSMPRASSRLAGRRAGITGLAEDGVQPLLGQVGEDHVDDAPGVVRLGLCGGGLVHGPCSTSSGMSESLPEPATTAGRQRPVRSVYPEARSRGVSL